MTTISAVKSTGEGAIFIVDGIEWTYAPIRGACYLNSSGEPVHQAPEGSFCLSEGQPFEAVAAHARLLGAQLFRRPA